MRIAVTHVTRLDFGAEVSETVMDARLGPRDDADQRVARFSVRLEPAGHVRRYEDGFGNIGHLLTNRRPHTFLQVSAVSEVQHSSAGRSGWPIRLKKWSERQSESRPSDSTRSAMRNQRSQVNPSCPSIMTPIRMLMTLTELRGSSSVSLEAK